MTWNHRVIRFEENGNVYYAIHECHYDKRGDTIPMSWTANAVNVLSETRRGLLWVLSVMTEAVAKPVLTEKDGKLVEVEPVQELSDDLRKILERTKVENREIV
jgi:hypothetical protein